MEEAHTDGLGETGAETGVWVPQDEEHQDRWQPPELGTQLPEGSYLVDGHTDCRLPAPELGENKLLWPQAIHLSYRIILHYS